MPENTQLNLGPQEKEILQAASRIYATLLAKADPGVDVSVLMKGAVNQAIDLATIVENAVADEGERYDDKQDMGDGIQILR